MVKVGPKVPPPTRRELERQERELKRAQGANGAQLGEPREHLAFLVHRKSRSKRPEASALGNSWRKREKNQKRTEARRLAKAKANISSLESQEYVDISRSDLSDYDTGNAKGPTVRGDNSEAPLPYLDSSSSEIHGVVVDPNDYSLGSLSGEFSSMTDTSVSISSSGNLGILDNSNSGLSAPSTGTPRLGVDITTGDFWSENNAPSPSLSKDKEDDPSAAMKILPKEPIHTEKPAEKTIDSPKPPSQAPLPAFSRILPSRKSRTAMNAAVAPPRLSSRKSSFIFSEPLDMSRYSNRSQTPTNGYSPRIGSGTFAQGSPDLFGNLLASGKRVDTPHIGTVHGPNLTPRAQASAYVSAKNLVKPADQSCLAGSETSYWNSRSANRNLLAVHATSARRVTRVASDSRITHVALSEEDDPVETFAKFDSVRNAFKSAMREKVSLETKKLYNDIGTPPPLQSNARLPSSEHGPFKNNKSGILPNSPGDTHRHLEHNTHFNDSIQNQTGSPSSNARAGADRAVENPSLNGSAIVESGTPVLAPAACITHDKKTKPCQLEAIQPSLLQPPAVENGHEASSIRYPDTPPTLCSGIVPPASTPRSPLLFALGLSSPPWSRPSILPRHTGDTNPEANTSSRGFVSALKSMLRKTLRYFWQRRG